LAISIASSAPSSRGASPGAPGWMIGVSATAGDDISIIAGSRARQIDRVLEKVLVVKGMTPLERLSPSVATTAGCRNLPDWQPDVSNSLVVVTVDAVLTERRLLQKADVQIAELRSK
jgi:hypothetical protein